MEVRHPGRSSGAAGQSHDDGRPPDDHREGHPRCCCLRVPDRRLHRAHVRPGGGTGNRHARPARTASETAMRTPSPSLSVVAEPPSPPAPAEPHPSPKPSASAKASAPASPPPLQSSSSQQGPRRQRIQLRRRSRARSAGSRAGTPEAEPALDLLDEVPPAAHPSEANDDPVGDRSRGRAPGCDQARRRFQAAAASARRT